MSAKRKVKAGARQKAVRRRRVKPAVLEATTLGVRQEHIVVRPELATANFSSLPPPNLPIASDDGLRFSWRALPLRRPLVSPRTSFWLGVGFGMLVVGTLMTLVWQILKVDLVQAVVVGLTRTP